MALKQYTEAIEGITYTTTTMPTTEGLVIIPKLVALLGESGMALLFATTEEERDSLADNDEVKAALMSSIAENAAEGDGLLVLRDLLRHTRCDKIKIGDNEVEGNVADRFDEHFAGRYMHLMHVALWVGRVSFTAP